MEEESVRAMDGRAADEHTCVLTVASAAYVDERMRAIVEVLEALPDAFAIPMALSDAGGAQPCFARELAALKDLIEKGSPE